MQAIALADEEQASRAQSEKQQATSGPGNDAVSATSKTDLSVHSAKLDPDEVDFDPNDPLNPLCWPTWRKWVIVLLVSAMSMMVNFATSTIIPAAPQILADFHQPNDLFLVLLVSIWEFGEGIGPFMYGPLAELYGRAVVYHIGNLFFILALVASALSVNLSMLIAFRFISGLSNTVLTLGPSIVGDLFEKEKRGMVMAVNIVLPIMGPVLAPIVGSYTAQACGWRWTIWIVVIIAGALALISLAVIPETYKVKILQKKARKLRETTGNDSLRSRYQRHTNKTTVIESLSRPIMMMIFSPPILIVSVYTALTYGIRYLIITRLTEIMETKYHFGQGPVGLTFLPNTIAALIAMLFYGLTSDRYMAYRKRKGKSTQAEYKLVFMLWGAVLLPCGILMFGWTARYHVQWMAPLIGTSLVSFALVLSILPTENYLVDIHDLYAASAIAAGVILRALSGAFIPLLSSPLYGKLGLGWGNSVLALMAVIFIPIIFLLIRYGEPIRKASRMSESTPSTLNRISKA